MGLPTAEHVLFIPAVLLVGFYAGWALGGRSARERMAARERRRKL
jgi:hypothetical protein